MSDTTPPPLPPGYIDPEHQGEDRDLSEVFYLRGIRAVLTHRPTVAAVRVADASISDEALEAEFRAWWNPPLHPVNVPDFHTVSTHVAWARHILKRGQP
jgi:hypothetical protein